MFDGLNESANLAIEMAKSFGAYNIRFKAESSFLIDNWVSEPLDSSQVGLSLIGDHADRRVFNELHTLIATSGIRADSLGVVRVDSIRADARTTRVKIGERPFFLKYGEGLDLIEDNSVVYVVVQSGHEANLSSLLEAHPEWAGRVQVVVLTLTETYYWDKYYYNATFKVHGAGAPKEGTFPDEERTYFEFVGKDFYILNHKVVWKGQVTDRDVAADINSLLAGNTLVVLTEQVPEVKLPLYEDAKSRLKQVWTLFDALSRGENGFTRIKPKLLMSGYKLFSEASPPVEKFKCELSGSPNHEVTEEIEEYFTLLEAVREIFPYVQSKAN
jgi:hypothetical protein